MYLLISALITQTIKDIILLFGYIQSTNSFPQPLTAEEEQYYLERYRLGDEDAKNILVERNLRLVAHIVKKYSSGKDNDDLISIGTIGLIKAIVTYKGEKGTRLATYAARCIENEILMTVRTNKKIRSEVSIHEPIGVDREGNEISLIDILGSDGDAILDKVELKIQIKKLYSKMEDTLKDREKVIIELRYGLINGVCKTQREIAEMLGISRSYVSRIEKRAIRKLYKELCNES